MIAPDLPGHGFTSLPPPARPVAAGDGAGAGRAARDAGRAAGARRRPFGRRRDPVPDVPRRPDRAAAAGQPERRLAAVSRPAGQLFSPMAKLAASHLAAAPPVRMARPLPTAVVERLIRDTGSTLDPTASNSTIRASRAARAMSPRRSAMMAQWDLHALVRDLPRLQTPLTLVVGGRDRAIPAVRARSGCAVCCRPRALSPARSRPSRARGAAGGGGQADCRAVGGGRPVAARRTVDRLPGGIAPPGEVNQLPSWSGLTCCAGRRAAGEVTMQHSGIPIVRMPWRNVADRDP